MADEQMDSRDERIGRILNEYLDRAQKGEAVSEDELLKDHPDLAEELLPHFGMLRQMSAAASGGRADLEPVIAPPAEALPDYEILGEIHRGGQGVVYRALQKATQREVAIKVMREGPFAGWRGRARFEREVRVLGALKHPSIVTIHESKTAFGCHFFVMDYIPGSALDAWGGQGPQPVRATLELFVSVCDAVNAAHTKGIIHRDLKPGNIRIDSDGRPCILDFGLAKVTGDEEDEADGPPGSMTAIGQFVGSLPWTSPEQAQGRLGDVDTRTDVYALGVILYQMLTGEFPYDVTGPMRDVLNRIVADEPKRPTRVRKEIDHDVEAIVLKCLRKEPERRYQTAGELGRDIERYLEGEPIAARSDSGLYVLRKMLRRHRVPVAVAVGFALLIGVSLLVSVSLWRQAAAERDRAVTAQREEEAQRQRADLKATEAEQALALAEARAEELRRSSYLDQIALARSAYEQQYVTRAEDLLEACPKDLRGWEWHYLSRLCRPATLLKVHADARSVVTFAVSPDGRRLFTGGSDGTIRVWDSNTGEAVAEWTGHTDQVNAVACSPDGRWLASGGRDKTLRLWDTRSGTDRIVMEDRRAVHCVCFSSDGTQLIAGSYGRVLTFFDVATGAENRKGFAHVKQISRVACSPDGKYIVTGEYLNPADGAARVCLWEIDTGQLVRAWAPHPRGVLTVAFSPDGRQVATGGGVSSASGDARGTLRVFDVVSGDEDLSLRGHEGFVDAVAFSPDGKWLASAGESRTPALGTEADHTVKIWDAATGEELRTYSAHQHGGEAIAWSPNGERVYSGGGDGTLKAWPRTPPGKARILEGHSGLVLEIEFSPDGQRLASCGGESALSPEPDRPPDNSIRVWDVESGSQLRILTQRAGAVPGLAWSPDGQSIATSGSDRTIRVWNADTGALQGKLPMPEGDLQGIAFSPNGEVLAGIAGYGVTLWSMPEKSEAGRLWHHDSLLSIDFSGDSRWIVACSDRDEILVWRRSDGEKHLVIPTKAGLNGAWFSPDSTLIASAHVDGAVVLWDMSTGERLRTMQGTQRSVTWLDFSPDGRRIASCTADRMLKIWDTDSGREAYGLRAHDTPLSCVRFSPDGTRIGTCGQDGLIKIWESRTVPAP